MKLPATATLEQASTLVHGVEAALGTDAGPLVIDASALASFDTSAIAVLLQARRLAQASGRTFEVTGAPAQLTQLAALYGVEPLLALAPAASAAHAAGDAVAS